MISGYLPFLIQLTLLIGFWGGIGAIDGWLRGQGTRQDDLNKSTLFGFIGGCIKGAGTLVMLISVALYLCWVMRLR